MLLKDNKFNIVPDLLRYIIQGIIKNVSGLCSFEFNAKNRSKTSFKIFFPMTNSFPVVNQLKKCINNTAKFI